MTLLNSFISSIQSDNAPASKWVKLAVARHKKDVEQSKTGLYWFDEDEVDAILGLFSLFRHTKGQYAKQPFKLLPWQAFLIGSIYGWKKKSDNTRRFTRIYTEVARKNGKTEVAAAIGLIEAFMNGEFGSEVYSAANKLDQASICWKSAATMGKFLRSDIEDFNELYIHESFNNRQILNKDNNSFFIPIASDSKTLDGLNPQCAIVDEYHEAVNNSVVNILENAMGSRVQPLTFIITTAGFNINGPCFQFRKVVCDILEGKKNDDSLFALIFTNENVTSWQTLEQEIEKHGHEYVFSFSNPSIGITPSMDYMMQLYRRAKNEGEMKRIDFLTKNMNVWTNTSATWIKDEVWWANQEEADLRDLAGRECFGGLDLAFKRDLTAFVLFFPARSKDERHIILPYFWIPEENADGRSREDGVPYLQWVADGYIETTPGNATDYDYIESKIIELSQEFNIRMIGYDHTFATQLATHLTTVGIEMSRVVPSYANMNEAILKIDEFANFKQDDIIGRFNHLGNPVLRWMMGNVVLKRDGGGRAILDKSKSTERIDGIAALAYAIVEWITEEPNTGPSKYEQDELFVI